MLKTSKPEMMNLYW